MNIVQDICRYTKAVNTAKKYGNKIGKAVCKIIRKVVPGLPITYSLGCKTSGIEVICFWNVSWRSESSPDRTIPVKTVVLEVFPELTGYVSSVDIFLSPEEAEKVKAQLMSLKK